MSGQEDSVVGSASWQAVAAGSHHSPHDILGTHPAADADGRTRTTIRARRPLAESVDAVFADGSRTVLEHTADGIWEGQHAGAPRSYRLATAYAGGEAQLAGDPYRHLPTIGELDLHLIGEGRHERLWEVLGANAHLIDGEIGIAFAVWAPDAKAVRVVGEHNGWSGEGHSMRSLGSSGVWELFVPGISPGTVYKYQILTPDDSWILKADPMAQRTQVPPETASIVPFSAYSWKDGAWMTRRAATHAVAQPMSIYEVHLGSWRGSLSYRDIADPLIAHV